MNERDAEALRQFLNVLHNAGDKRRAYAMIVSALFTMCRLVGDDVGMKPRLVLSEIMRFALGNADLLDLMGGSENETMVCIDIPVKHICCYGMRDFIEFFGGGVEHAD